MDFQVPGSLARCLSRVNPSGYSTSWGFGRGGQQVLAATGRRTPDPGLVGAGGS